MTTKSMDVRHSGMSGNRSWGRQSWLNLLYACLCGVMVSTVLTVWRGMDALYSRTSRLDETGVWSVIRDVLNTAGKRFSLVMLIVAVVLVFAVLQDRQRVGTWLYRFRYPVALALLIVLVAWGVSGSSLGLWDRTLSGNSMTEGLLAGSPRGVRTDEWALFTAMTFAQFNDPIGQLQYYSSVFRGVPTDMFIIYGQPVWDIAMIFRPFQWGYLVLGLEHGLSFFWFGRLIALFMATFEFGMLLTRRSKPLSLGLAALISFAPVVQWWFSINGFVEMIVFTEVIVICMHAFFSTNTVWKKALLCVPLIVCTGGFAFTLYPAWEIPMAYILCALLVGILIADRDVLRFDLKKDLPILAVGIVILIAGMGYVMWKSGDTISAVMNTAYPGKRVNTGGERVSLSVRYPISYFLPYLSAKSSPRFGGSVDAGTMFIDFFPLGLIAAFWVLCREKQRDAVLISLLVPTILFSVYVYVGMPEWMARATLLSHSIALRCAVQLSLLNLLLLFRAVALVKKGLESYLAVVISAVCAVAVTIGCHFAEPEVMGWGKCVVAAVIVFVAMATFLLKKPELIAMVCCFTALIAGLPVNPLQQGIAPVTDNAVIRDIRKVVESDPKAKWFSAVDWQSNIPTLAGAHTINATNTYPNPELWETLDGNRSNSEIWNRYAHIQVSITSEPTKYELKQVDVIKMQINPHDLVKIDAKYVLVNNNESCQALERSARYRRLVTENGYSIYQRK